MAEQSVWILDHQQLCEVSHRVQRWGSQQTALTFLLTCPLVLFDPQQLSLSFSPCLSLSVILAHICDTNVWLVGQLSWTLSNRGRSMSTTLQFECCDLTLMLFWWLQFQTLSLTLVFNATITLVKNKINHPWHEVFFRTSYEHNILETWRNIMVFFANKALKIRPERLLLPMSTLCPTEERLTSVAKKKCKYHQYRRTIVEQYSYFLN